VRLQALRSITTAAEVWNRQGRASAWLYHRGSRLRAASSLNKVERYQRQLGPVHQAYLVACSHARLARAGRVCAVLLSLLAIGAAAGVTVDNKLTFESLLAQADTLNQRSDFFDRNSDYPKAVRLALAVLPGGSLFDWSRPRECLGETVADSECALRRTGSIEPMVHSPAPKKDGEKYTTHWDPLDGLEVEINDPAKGTIKITIPPRPGAEGFSSSDDQPSVNLDPTFRRLLIIYKSQSPTLIDVETGKTIADLTGYVFEKPASRSDTDRNEVSAEFSADGGSILTTKQSQDTRLWNAADGSLRKQFRGYVEFVAGTGRILAYQGHELIDSKSLAPIAKFAVSSWAGVNDAKTMAAGSDKQGHINVWDLSDGTLHTTLQYGGPTAVLNFWANPSGSRIVTLAKEGHFDKLAGMAFWDGQTSRQLAEINNFSLSAFFYSPTVTFANGADRLALWTVDHDVLAWNGAQLIRSSAITKAQIGTSPWFGEDAGAPLEYSADGRRLLAQRFSVILVLDSTNLAPVSLLRIPLQNDNADSGYVPRATFEDANGAQVRSGTTVWHLLETGRLHGKDLRDWMCSATRLKASEYDHSITADDRQNWYLGGRPPDVCMWKGLTTAVGWRQLIARLWFVVSGRDVYAAG
jgi:WD40 repeat protein